MSEFLKWFAMLLSLLDGDPDAAAAAAAAPAEEPICIISDACLTYKTMGEKLVNKDNTSCNVMQKMISTFSEDIELPLTLR